MGIFSSIKKLFFATESVVKSAADKSVDYAKETGSDLLDSTKDLAESAGSSVLEKTSGLRDAVTDGAGDFMERAKGYAEDLADSDIVTKAKDAVQDVTDSVTETATSLSTKAKGAHDNAAEGSILDKVGDVADTIGNTAKVIGGAASEKVKKIAHDLGETDVVKKAASVSESVGDKVLDAGEAFMGKAKSVSESVGEKVLDKGGDVLDSAASMSETIGGKALHIKDDIVARAKDITSDLGDKLDETIAKAEAMAAEEAANPKPKFSEDTLNAGGSLLDGTDDFFSKAAKFGEGDYNAFSEGRIDISPGKVKSPREISKAAGFTDHDGDGNELIDDAIISEEE